MKVLGESNGYYYFAPRKREQTDTAIDKISEILQCDISYIGITAPDDSRINGYQDAMQYVSDLDWGRYNLIIVQKVTEPVLP